MGSAPGRYAIGNWNTPVSLSFSFSASSCCLVFSELTQASELLQLTAARGSDPSFSPSLFRSLSPVEVLGVRSSLI